MTAVRLAIVGTRVLRCPGDMLNAARLTEEWIKRLQPQQVISGGAEGADTVASLTAEVLGYREATRTLVIFRPTARRFHGPGGYRERDARIAAECTHLLRLSCRQATTYGSGWTADEAQSLGRIVMREQVCATDTAPVSG